MWAVLFSALTRVIAWCLGTSTIKWMFSAFLFFGVALLFDVVLDLLPAWFNADSLTGSTTAFTPEIWYFIDYFEVQAGISLVLSAYVIRFLIRRIPVIG